ncbi:unnamed protein product [Timema podura]|uniref:Uncharacterized protein n=1 Tax=Timema podura TaxID=61482 RepID=A0ABN7P2M0_TIMPD|nr:unnamed protein product [Timema podura]
MTVPSRKALNWHFANKRWPLVQTFDEEQAVAITKANAAISCSSVSVDLAYVKRNFGNLLGAMTALEARDLPLVKAVKLMRGIEEKPETGFWLS